MQKPLGKRELAKQERYYALMDANARVFSTRMIQHLELVPVSEYIDGENDFLASENLLEEENSIMYFTHEGYKYVSFDDFERYQNHQDVKVFDPYNNIRLCVGCVAWYIRYNLNVDLSLVDIIAVTNQKMNDPGYAKIQFADQRELIGNEYNRDCLKYMDLIYKMAEAHPIEFNELKSLDMVNYDEFK